VLVLGLDDWQAMLWSTFHVPMDLTCHKHARSIVFVDIKP
jgi:hypothetical protein